MSFKLLKDWGAHKKGDTVELVDKAVIFKATQLGVIENPQGAEKPVKAQPVKGEPTAVSTQSGTTHPTTKKGAK